MRDTHPTKGYTMKIQTARKAAKTIVRIVVGSSVTYAVSHVIVNNLAPESPTEKVETVVGAMTLGLVASSIVDGYTDSFVDGVFTAFGAPESE